MKVIYDPPKKNPGRDYPYLAASAYNIVLFSKENTGTVIACIRNTGGYDVGYHTDTWAEHECFHSYEGTVTLANS